MSKIRFTLEFHREADRRAAAGVVTIPRDAVAVTPRPDKRASIVSVVLPKEDATFEKAVSYATGLLPQGPVWSAPRLISATEIDG